MTSEYYAPVHPLPVYDGQPSTPAIEAPLAAAPLAAAAAPLAVAAPLAAAAAPLAAEATTAVGDALAPAPVVGSLVGNWPGAEPLRVVEHPVQAHPNVHRQLPHHQSPVEHRPGHPHGLTRHYGADGAQALPPIPPAQVPANELPPTQMPLAQYPSAPPHHRAAPYYPAPQRPVRPKNHVFAIVASALIAAIFASGFTAAAFTLLRPGNVGGISIGAFNPPGQPTPLDPGRVDPAPIVGGDTTTPNWQAVAAEVFNSVVSIQVITPQGGSVGSGFVLDTSGHVVTNAHVVAGAQNDTVTVTLADGRLFQAAIIGADARTDLAVVRLNQPPADLHPVALGDSTTVHVGDPVLAVGNPLSLANTVTQGIVSALNRPVQASGGGADPVLVTTTAIQIDAAINPGNSGGPLFNKFGQVIGVNSSIASLSAGVFGGTGGSIGLGFAIPVNLAKHIAAQLIESGEAEHPFLGVSMDPQAAIVSVNGVTRRGARINAITPGTPAEDVGLQVGDVVVAFNGLPIPAHEALTALVGERHVGDHAVITIVRNGEALELEVVLTTRAVLADLLPPAPLDEPDESGIPGEDDGNGQGPLDDGDDSDG